jgi:hypothetical protein
MFEYGTLQSKKAPGPQIYVEARSPVDESLRAEVDAIIDTGAAITCLPLRVIRQLNPDDLDYRKVTVRGPVGWTESRKAYIVHLKILRCEFRDLEVVGLDRDYALIGRDILNGYAITVDGPTQRWSVNARC